MISIEEQAPALQGETKGEPDKSDSSSSPSSSKIRATENRRPLTEEELNAMLLQGAGTKEQPVFPVKGAVNIGTAVEIYHKAVHEGKEWTRETRNLEKGKGLSSNYWEAHVAAGIVSYSPESSD